MSKRLKMARELLSEKGVIFMSIDDNEQAQLKLLCDQIFSEGNFVANLIWKKKSTSTNVKNVKISPQVEYVLCYQKTQMGYIRSRVKLKETRTYNHVDEIGNYRLTIIEKKNSGDYKRETMVFEILEQKPRDGKRWQIGEEKARELEKNNRFINDNGIIKLKIYDFEDKDTESAQPSLLDNHGTTDTGGKSLAQIFGEVETFNNPKPVELIKHLIDISSQPNSTILDFMAGSGTTGQAVLELNKEDGGNRQFILVTNNELNGVGSKLVESEKLKVKSEKFDVEQFGICRRVTRERLKRVIEGYTNSKGVFVEGLSGNKLRYFRADFVEPIEEMEDETMLILAENSLEILKIKENCFDLVETNREYAIFRNSENNQILAVYYTEDRRKLEEFKQKVEALDKTTSCYIFSYMVSKFANFFDNNPKITVKDFPEGVYKVLKVNN